MLRITIQDKYNNKKMWRITKLSHGYYLHQFICGRQFGRGQRITRRQIREIGIDQMKLISVTIKKNG